MSFSQSQWSGPQYSKTPSLHPNIQRFHWASSAPHSSLLSPPSSLLSHIVAHIKLDRFFALSFSYSTGCSCCECWKMTEGGGGGVDVSYGADTAWYLEMQTGGPTSAASPTPRGCGGPSAFYWARTQYGSRLGWTWSYRGTTTRQTATNICFPSPITLTLFILV